MDRDELIFEEYKLYVEQKDNFIDRNFATNRFYMISFAVIIFAMIYTSNAPVLGEMTSNFLLSMVGVAVCTLWWMNVDSYNTLIKVKFADVIEKIEEQLPVKPYTQESEGIDKFKTKKIFMFSDIQKCMAIISALFFFAIFISEIAPIIAKFIDNMTKTNMGI